LRVELSVSNSQFHVHIFISSYTLPSTLRCYRNFAGKFLISRSGEVVRTDNTNIEQQVRALLAETANSEL